MGNHMSCMSPSVHHYMASSHGCNNIIYVLHSDSGSISEFEETLTAAELMMEYPCQFVCCHSSVVSNGHRMICPVPADEELRPGEFYILLPMHKLNSRFSTEEVEFLSALVLQGFGRKPLTGKHSSKATSQSKVVPLPRLTGTAAVAAGVSLQNSVRHSMWSLSARPDVQSALPLGCAQTGPTVCRSKSWIPKLETITEAPMSIAF